MLIIAPRAVITAAICHVTITTLLMIHAAHTDVITTAAVAVSSPPCLSRWFILFFRFAVAAVAATSYRLPPAHAPPQRKKEVKVKPQRGDT